MNGTRTGSSIYPLTIDTRHAPQCIVLTHSLPFCRPGPKSELPTTQFVTPSDDAEMLASLYGAADLTPADVAILVDLGVERTSDLNVVKSGDLAEAGMKQIRIKKVMRMIELSKAKVEPDSEERAKREAAERKAAPPPSFLIDDLPKEVELPPELQADLSHLSSTLESVDKLKSNPVLGEFEARCSLTQESQAIITEVDELFSS